MEPNHETHAHTHTPHPHPHIEKHKPMLSIQGSILISGIMIAFAILVSNGTFGMAPMAKDGEQAPKVVNIKDVITDGEPYIGNPTTPAIAYFSDYQCPFCKKFEQQVLATIITDYVQTNKVHVVFKDFSFLGKDSTTAAIFARAVWNLYPTKYFEWREAMFAAQDDEGDIGFGDRLSIEALTRKISGIDQAKVSAAVDANVEAYEQKVIDNYTEGQKLGVQGTPSVIIGKNMVDGAYPLATYTDLLKKIVK